MPLQFVRKDFPPEVRKTLFDNVVSFRQEPYRVAPHVWMVSGHIDQSDFLLDTGAGLILIDTPIPAYGPVLLENIRKLGYDPKDIRLLLLSHEHFDHDGGARLVQDVSGCKIYLSKEAWQAKLEPVPAPESVTGLPPMPPVAPYEPDVFYADDQPIRLGRFTIRTLWTPGHTHGVTSFFFEDTDDVTGKTYRVALHGGLGIDNMRPGRCGEPWAVSFADRDRFIDQCLELSLLDVDITLASHSMQANINANIPRDRSDYTAFVEPRTWPVMLLERRGAVMEFRAGANR